MDNFYICIAIVAVVLFLLIIIEVTRTQKVDAVLKEYEAELKAQEAQVEAEEIKEHLNQAPGAIIDQYLGKFSGEDPGSKKSD